MEERKNNLIVIVGFGWVGQANAIALVKTGYQVAYYDPAEKIIFHYTEEIEIYSQVRRIYDLKQVDSPSTSFVVCVGDAVDDDRTQDISRIENACSSLRGCDGTVILRSTVLPQKLKELYFDIYVPEFLHEKNAVDESINPYYCVIGFRKDIVPPPFLIQWERKAYKSFRGTPEEASYIKYLSNIWNSVRIAFVNEMGDSMGDPSTQEGVRKIEKILDFVLERKSYLRYGQAFDGHCLPKDTRAYIGAHIKEGKNLDMLIGTYNSNEHHKKLQEKYQSLPKVFSFWDYTQKYNSVFASLWQSVNSFAAVKHMRKELRFVMDAIQALIPERSIRRSAEIWESKAQENSKYYAHPQTRGGKNVSEKELCESGIEDYETYIASDPQLSKVFDGEGDRTALDFGCGVGRVTPYLAKHFSRVQGLDISPTMIDEARKRIDDDSVTFATFEGCELPYGNESIDFLFSYHTLQHVPTHKNVEFYIKEFNRILKKDGLAKIQLRGGRGVKRWEWSYGASYTPEEAIRLVERNGFIVLNHQVIGIKNIWLTLKK